MLNLLTYSERILILIAAIATMVIIGLTSSARAADLNSQNDLCTGSNLTVQDNAGCGKVKDPNTGKFVDAKTEDSAGSKFDNLVNDFVNIASVIVGIASVVMIIYGGFRILASAGNPESTKTGRNAILYALIGLVIVAFAQTIVKFILSKIM